MGERIAVVGIAIADFEAGKGDADLIDVASFDLDPVIPRAKVALDGAAPGDVEAKFIVAVVITTR